MHATPSGAVITEVMVANKDTRYGTIDGEVTWVTADALTLDPQNSNSANNPASNGQAPLASFPAHVKLNKQTIDVEGKTMPVKPRLNITAEIKAGRRTVLNYLLSPIQRTIGESVGCGNWSGRDFKKKNLNHTCCLLYFCGV